MMLDGMVAHHTHTVNPGAHREREGKRREEKRREREDTMAGRGRPKGTRTLVHPIAGETYRLVPNLDEDESQADQVWVLIREVNKIPTASETISRLEEWSEAIFELGIDSNNDVSEELFEDRLIDAHNALSRLAGCPEFGVTRFRLISSRHKAIVTGIKMLRGKDFAEISKEQKRMLTGQILGEADVAVKTLKGPVPREEILKDKACLKL